MDRTPLAADPGRSAQDRSTRGTHESHETAAGRLTRKSVDHETTGCTTASAVSVVLLVQGWCHSARSARMESRGQLGGVVHLHGYPLGHPHWRVLYSTYPGPNTTLRRRYAARSALRAKGQMARFRYQDFLDELVRGDRYGVFIDDTGSPGLDTGNLDLHPERASWVAVVVSPEHMPEILEQFPGALDELSRLLRSTEFHFGDIYAGRKEYRGVPVEVRLALFEFMAKIFQEYRFPIIVQTFDPETLSNIRCRAPFPEKVGPFNLNLPVDAALFFLLIRLKLHLEEQGGVPTLARVFVDEGYKRNGAAIRIPAFDKVFADGLICFARSSSIHPIQLADFAAFSLNRTQLLLGKPVLSDLDERLLEILSPIAWNYVNIEKAFISLEDWSRPKRLM